MFRLSIITILLIAVGGLCVQAAEPWTAADFEPISSGIECPASLALRIEGDQLHIALGIGTIPGTKAVPMIQLGVAAMGKVVLINADAVVQQRPDGRTLFAFTVPMRTLAQNKNEWASLRIGAAAVFPDGPYGQPLYRVRYRHTDGRAVHADFATDPQAWLPFDYAAYRQRVSDRTARVIISFKQPFAGKATIVIDDALGHRVRNLVSGQTYAAGTQQVEWDLRDDNGHVVQPGQYTWRSLYHKGIVPEYLFSYCNDGNPPWRTGSGEDAWGPDHSCFTAVAACGDHVYVISPCAEAGYQGAVMDLQGIKRETWGGPGVGKYLLASDGQQVFAAYDNCSRQTILRYQQGKGWVPFTKAGHEVEWGKVAFAAAKGMAAYGTGDTAFKQANWEAFNLAGFAVAGTRLAVASRADNAILLYDAETGDHKLTLALPDPGALAGLADGTLFAVSGKSIVRFAPGAITPTPFVPAGQLTPGGMTTDTKGHLYVIDTATSQIAILDAVTGKELKRLGTLGGKYAGKYDPERMVQPLVLAVADNGWLWVTENRFNPKRVLAWDLHTGKVVKEKFGSTSYGANGAGFDPVDSTRFVGQGAIWSVNLAKKTAVPTSILFADAETMPTAMHWRFLRREGRTFLLGGNSYNSLVEVLPDGSGRLLGAYGQAQAFCFDMGQQLPQVFLETFYQKYGLDTPEKRKGLHEGRLPHNGEFFTWSDRNGDGQMQSDELEFAGGDAGGYWGTDSESLTIQRPMQLGATRCLLELPVQGWYPGGAPRWKPLADGMAEIRKITPEGWWGTEAGLVDRNGTLFVNSRPLVAIGPDNVQRWSYPNNWNGVHGSHDAPLPHVGELQGALFFLGNAPLADGKTDVFVLNGNHGRFFALTSDGFYLDEFFKDVRVGAQTDAYLIGGECFGGFFGKSNDGNYYLISGHTDYRIFQLHGLESIVRGVGGTISLTPAQIESADRLASAVKVASAQPARATIPWVASSPLLDGSGTGWPTPPAAAWDKDGQFPVQVQAGYDATTLYLRWAVNDPSPWKNNGKESKLLFKTGDSVDMQLGCNPEAVINRLSPVPGDLRLLIAPYQGKPTAVLYRHRVPGTTKPVPFSSPWRTENVDQVQNLTSARINVTLGGNGYTVEAAIPLADLGLKPVTGKPYRADFGVIFGDPDGQFNQLRSYWSNKATGLVNDVPGEIMLEPNAWGTITFGEGK